MPCKKFFRNACVVQLQIIYTMAGVKGCDTLICVSALLTVPLRGTLGGSRATKLSHPGPGLSPRSPPERRERGSSTAMVGNESQRVLGKGEPMLKAEAPDQNSVVPWPHAVCATRQST